MARLSLWLSFHSAVSILLATTIHHAAAHPYPKNDLYSAGYGYLEPRQCAQACGYGDRYCCEAGYACYTAGGIAGCSATAGGAYQWYTTTWTETATFTKTYNSYIPAATGPAGGGDCVPPEGSGQIACGNICCAKWQYCAYDGQCMANNIGPGEDGGGGIIATTITTGGQTITTQFSAPYRVTSGTATSTADGAATDTAGAVSPDGGTAGHLSGGAIAGIVVGTLAGIALLLLICACCVVRGLWHGVLALFGMGKKKDDDSDHYTRRDSTHSRRDNHSSWYAGAVGGRPSGVGSRKEEKEKSKGKGLLGLGAALGTMALLLGLKRDKNKKKAATHTRSDVSSSYWSDSYTGASPSSRSSDRRTRQSRHSRHASHSRHSPGRAPSASRVTRTTHTHTRVSRAPSARSHRSPR